MSAERLVRLALVYLVAALLVGGWAEARIDAELPPVGWTAEP